jgi:hypothetical protein
VSTSAVTLLIAVVGLGLAIASLVWQAATFVLSGARVRVEIQIGAHDGAGTIMSGPPESLSQGMGLLARQGYANEMIGARVRNRGRMAMSVESFEVVFSNKIALSHPGNGLGPDFPYRLEPQSSASWFLALDPVRHAVATSASTLGTPNPDRVRVRVGLGNGKAALSASFPVEGS